MEKVSFHSNSKEEQYQRMLKLLDNYAHFPYQWDYVQSFKLGFSSMWTENFQMFKLDLEKAEEPEIKLPTFIRSQRKQGNPRKTCTSASLTMRKSLTMWITTNGRNFLKRQEYKATFPVSWETCMQVKKQQLEPYMVGRGFRMGNTCTPVADSCRCMAKPIQYCN